MDLNITHYTNNVYQSFGSALISEETRRKLIALGIDPSTVTSEAMAKILIEKAEETYQAINTDKPELVMPNKNICSNEVELIWDAKELAQKMGIHLSKDTKLEDILTVIAQNIEQVLNNNPNEDVKSKYLEYNNELNSIKVRYSTVTQNENNIIMSMMYNANINKMILGL